jgi:hypothetical protein
LTRPRARAVLLVEWALHGLALYLRRISWRFLLCCTLCNRHDGQARLEQSGFIDHAIASQTQAAPVRRRHSVQGLGAVRQCDKSRSLAPRPAADNANSARLVGRKMARKCFLTYPRYRSARSRTLYIAYRDHCSPGSFICRKAQWRRKSRQMPASALSCPAPAV